MGVSRGPVREAIRQLEREGLLVSHPYRETVVSDLRLEEVKDILIPIRFHLEWYVLKKYIAAVDEAFFEDLQDIVHEMEASAASNEPDRLVELDIAFHEALIRLAEERTVVLTWQSILNQIRLHFIKNIAFYDKQNITSDHQALLNALQTKDLDVIQKELIRHIKCDESFLCFLE